MRISLPLLLLAFGAMFSPPPATAKDTPTHDIPKALQDYVAAADDSFEWKIRESDYVGESSVVHIDLTSQTWQGIVWKHALTAFVPDNIRHDDTVLLFITGGNIGDRPEGDDLAMGAKLSTLAQTPVVFLHQVPNQPLLGDKVEDDLITETFLRYLKTKDATWPLLFPMVKSAVRAMDAVQELAEENYGVEIRQFVVTGGSKRGWTTWLSAVADDRVAGIAPIVIDTLNMPPQMGHQMESWGEYSEQIIDYTSKGLVEYMEKNPDVPLWRWVDPFTYRKQLTLPKLLVNGTNDRYWVVDAMNLYWDDLVGEKHALYVPNAGHGLDDGKEAALTTIAVFTQHIAMRRSLPKLSWTHGDNGNDQMRLEVRSEPPPKSVRLWIADSGDKDFRPAKWSPRAIESNGDGSFVGLVDKPDAGHRAFFAEAVFEFGPISYGLSTQIRRE